MTVKVLTGIARRGSFGMRKIGHDSSMMRESSAVFKHFLGFLLTGSSKPHQLLGGQQPFKLGALAEFKRLDLKLAKAAFFQNDHALLRPGQKESNKTAQVGFVTHEH